MREINKHLNNIISRGFPFFREKAYFKRHLARESPHTLFCLACDKLSTTHLKQACYSYWGRHAQKLPVPVGPVHLNSRASVDPRGDDFTISRFPFFTVSDRDNVNTKLNCGNEMTYVPQRAITLLCVLLNAVYAFFNSFKPVFQVHLQQ